MEHYGSVHCPDKGGGEVKRLLNGAWAVLSSRALSPVVIGVFLLLYIGIAFATDDALIVLMEITRRSIVVKALLALLPLNSASRIVTETGRHLRRRRSLIGNPTHIQPGLFDETVTVSASPAFAELQGRLDTLRYNTRRSELALTAWRGASVFPARLLFLVATFCLFTGILVSISGRASYRRAVIEGEPFPVPAGDGGIVERILLKKSPGLILAKDLTLDVAGAVPGEGKKTFGLYPPSRYSGAFVYPRYLGIALHVRFSAPDLTSAYEGYPTLAIYPPGREATVGIPDSSYRIVFSLMKPEDGTDPYITGRMIFLFKLLKGKEVLFRGNIPNGGEYVKDGYQLVFPDARRLVVTDFIRDYGVQLIWAAGVLFVIAGCVWLPVRIFFPRREMLFKSGQDGIVAFSRAEGGNRKHDGVFHEALDLLEVRRFERVLRDG